MEQRLMSPPRAALAQSSAQDQVYDRLSDPAMIPQFQHCVEACLQCFESCEQMMVHLSTQENVDPNLIRLLNDVVEITQVSATFMLRGSNFLIRISAVCAEVCKFSAEALEKLPANADDELIKSCITELKDCSVSCDQMAHHH